MTAAAAVAAAGPGRHIRELAARVDTTVAGLQKWLASVEQSSTATAKRAERKLRSLEMRLDEQAAQIGAATPAVQESFFAAVDDVAMVEARVVKLEQHLLEQQRLEQRQHAKRIERVITVATNRHQCTAASMLGIKQCGWRPPQRHPKRRSLLGPYLGVCFRRAHSFIPVQFYFGK